MSFTGAVGAIFMFPLSGIIRLCVVLRIHPNVLTFIGVCINLAAAWALGVGRFVLAGVIMVAANLFDFIDGKVAHETGMASEFGGFWDSVMDRFSDLALFLGLVYLYASLQRADYVLVTALAMTFTVLTSYARARAESLIDKCKVGFMERPERIVLFMIGAFTNRMAAVLWVILVLSVLDGRRPHLPHLARARGPEGDGMSAAPGPDRGAPAAPAALLLAHLLLDLRAHDHPVRPDGHRHPRVRVAHAARLARRPHGARHGPAGLAAGLVPLTGLPRVPIERHGVPQSFLSHVLLLLGAGFLVANVRILVDVTRFFRMRSRALLTWPSPIPRYYGLFLAMAAMLGVVLLVKLFYLRLPPTAVFGEAMMLTYYGYLVPLSIRIGRGFYEDGVWVDNGFLPYHEIGGLSWREGDAAHAPVHPADEAGGAQPGGARAVLRRDATPAARQDRPPRHRLLGQGARPGRARRAG